MLDNILLGLTNIFQLPNIAAMFGGTALGLFVGAMPGLSATMAIALLVPVTFALTPETGITMLASLYIKAQKRQSAFTVISIAAAVAIMAMIFLLYGVFIDCYRIRTYYAAPYHLMFSKLTEEQGEAMQNEEHVRSVKLQKTQDGTVTAWIQFDGNIGDGELWLQTAVQHIGAVKQFEKKYRASLKEAKKGYLIKYRILYGLMKKFNKKKIWLISDRVNKANDNGEHLFRYVNSIKDNDRKFYYYIENK